MKDLRVRERVFRSEEEARKVAVIERKRLEQEEKVEEEVKRLRDS